MEHLRRHVKPSNKEELVTGIKQFWSTPPDATRSVYLCSRYTNHLQKVIPAVIEHGGGATGY